MANCKQAQVTIQKVVVQKSESYGVFGEPGNSAEWELHFSVAGQSAVIRFDNVRDGSVLIVNRSFLVDTGPLESLRVEVSGVEIDDTSANDPLPTATKIITPASNWAEGQTFDVSAPSSEDFAYSFTFDIRCASTSQPLTTATNHHIYALTHTRDLLWYRHDGRNDGSWKWFDNNARKVGTGWDFKQVFSGDNCDGVIYAITYTGDLLWYRHEGRNDGSFKWFDGAGRKVGSGWDFKQVFSGGDGVIYAITYTGDLLWYRHEGRNDGSWKWFDGTGRKVGTGWDFKQVFSGGDGVIYAITHTNDLLWYRHDGRNDGSWKWFDGAGRKVGTGWDFKQVFSGGDGVIYAITHTNDLLWYRHDGRNDGSWKWFDGTGRKVGTGWDVRGIFSDCNSVR